VISSSALSLNTDPLFSSTPEPSSHTHTHSFFASPFRRQVFTLREQHRSCVDSSSSYPHKDPFKGQSSSSTMRASIVFVALGALALKAGAWDTETDTVSTTTTLTVLSCHPTVTNCPVSLSIAQRLAFAVCLLSRCRLKANPRRRPNFALLNQS
jgi:hypothetical protein